jgi:hypothetical protein
MLLDMDRLSSLTLTSMPLFCLRLKEGVDKMWRCLLLSLAPITLIIDPSASGRLNYWGTTLYARNCPLGTVCLTAFPHPTTKGAIREEPPLSSLTWTPPRSRCSCLAANYARDDVGELEPGRSLFVPPSSWKMSSGVGWASGANAGP